MEDGDKAFWISFADLMTALMVLFMMVMAVALLSITRTVVSKTPAPVPVAAAPPAPAASVSRDMPDGEPDPEAAAVHALLQQLAQAVDAAPGVKLDAERHAIDFGERARFATGSHRIDADGARALREFAPALLQVTGSELGRRWVRRVVVEGFADPRGSYLYNLNLSLQRSQQVLCSLLEPAGDGSALTTEQQQSVRGIFAVGGFSFNDPRDSLEASRRIELRIEFGQAPARPAQVPDQQNGSCALGA